MPARAMPDNASACRRHGDAVVVGSFEFSKRGRERKREKSEREGQGRGGGRKRKDGEAGKTLPRGRPHGMQNKAANPPASKAKENRPSRHFSGLRCLPRARAGLLFVGVAAKSKIRRSLINCVTPRELSGRRKPEGRKARKKARRSPWPLLISRIKRNRGAAAESYRNTWGKRCTLTLAQMAWQTRVD